MTFKPDPPVNPKDTLSNYVRTVPKQSGVTFEVATIFSLIGLLGAFALWLLNNQVSLEKRLATLETQSQHSQQSLERITIQLDELNKTIDMIYLRSKSE